RPPGSKTRMFLRWGYSAATRPRLSHMPRMTLAISPSESRGKARSMLRRARLEMPRCGPIRRPIAPPRADAQSSGNIAKAPNNNATAQASRWWIGRDALAGLLGQLASIPMDGSNDGVQKPGERSRLRPADFDLEDFDTGAPGLRHPHDVLCGRDETRV